MNVVVLIMVAALGAGQAAPTAVDSTLDRYVAALGGEEAVARCQGRTYQGTLIHEINWYDPPHQEIPFVADHRGKGTFRHADGADLNDLRDIPPEDEGGKLDWLLHPRSALVIAEYFPDLEFRGRQARDGCTFVVLEAPQLETAYWALYFDVETGLLSHIGHYWDLEDYREVDGVLFPHRIVTGRKGGSSTYEFKRVVSEFGVNPK